MSELKPRPRAGTSVTLTYEDEQGKTYMLVLTEISLGQHGNRLSLHGYAGAEGPAHGIDRRIDNQKATINRLMAHLATHCPELMGTGTCQANHP